MCLEKVDIRTSIKIFVCNLYCSTIHAVPSTDGGLLRGDRDDFYFIFCGAASVDFAGDIAVYL